MIILLALAVSAAPAALRGETVEYRHGETVLEGFLAWDDSLPGARPGVLVVHEWTGIGPYVKRRVDELARLGYVAFAADIYGKGVRPAGGAEAAKTASIYKDDRPLMRARAQAGFDVLRAHPLVDRARVAAIGYCFGGTTALELARSGAPLAGVVSVHGGLGTPLPADPGGVKAAVLVLHGADDPFVPPEEVRAFEAEMRRAGADWRLVAYGGAVHSFTNPEAGSDPSRGAAYDARADRRSWRDMQVFFEEIFGRK
jgi:dienelactone hydrolase